MHAWLATTPRTRINSVGRLFQPSRTARQSPYSHRPDLFPRRALIREASAAISPRSINVSPTVPLRNEPLHRILSKLASKADTFINPSRLDLALRGLTTPDAVVRVAVLSIDDAQRARKLAHLLLADPLSAKEKWEDVLEGVEDSEGGAVLLRYDDDFQSRLSPDSNLRILSIPSKTLQRHNLEIFVGSLGSALTDTPKYHNSLDTFLVPTILSANPQPEPAHSFPVHKTLVFGSGIDSATTYGRLLSQFPQTKSDLIKLVIGLKHPGTDVASAGEESASLAVDLELATEALERFRQSTSHAEAYQTGWHGSGMPALSSWLSQNTELDENGIPATLNRSILSLLKDLETGVSKRRGAAIQPQNLLPVQKSYTHLSEQLQVWAEQGHAELRDQLDAAFTTANWRRLAWWKLLWRTDDVEMVLSEILERHWLVKAEKKGTFLAGSLHQSNLIGQITTSNSRETTWSRPDTAAETQTATGQDSWHPVGSSKAAQDTAASESLFSPIQISAVRGEILRDTIPPLQALAQRLVLTTLSTTSLTSALSALLYVSLSSLSMFEAGAVASLGFIFSLRRTQQLWETARTNWQAGIREEGRRVLKESQDNFQVEIEKGERDLQPTNRQEAKELAELIEKARSALEQQGKS